MKKELDKENDRLRKKLSQLYCSAQVTNKFEKTVEVTNTKTKVFETEYRTLAFHTLRPQQAPWFNLTLEVIAVL